MGLNRDSHPIGIFQEFLRLFHHIGIHVSNSIQDNGATGVTGKIFVSQALIPSLEDLMTKFNPARHHPPHLFTTGNFFGNRLPFFFAGEHVHTMGGLNSCHARTLFLNDFLHGAGGFVGVDITKLPPVYHKHLAGFFFGSPDLADELALQFRNVLVKSRCRKKQMRGI